MPTPRPVLAPELKPDFDACTVCMVELLEFAPVGVGETGDGLIELGSREELVTVLDATSVGLTELVTVAGEGPPLVAVVPAAVVPSATTAELSVEDTLDGPADVDEAVSAKSKSAHSRLYLDVRTYSDQLRSATSKVHLS